MDANDMPLLRQGSINENVIALQEYLASLGFFNGTISNIFSKSTTDAVKNFQIQNNLTADGIVGPKTWNALIGLYNASNNIYNNASSFDSVGTQNYTIHIVQPGETLESLADYYGTTVDAIKLASSLRSNSLVVGQSVVIPFLSARESSYQENTETPSSSGGQNIFYNVISGDNLWALSRRYGTTVDAIKSASGITSDALSIGQRLIIPAGSSSTTTTITPQPSSPVRTIENEYIVKSGDNLWALSRRYGTTVDAIKSASGITSDALSIGQRLIIPAGNSSSIIGVVLPCESNTSFIKGNYTVKSGDNLWALSRRYGTTVEAIKSASGITSDALSIGQILTIPGL
ncbi:MAG: LysM peptidoglycan-binding domain-containing protein [Oscillospiraceae bacterium]|nr:LysM peptidoglycan-binding domain-containing protein [Oscillospiraceae bacterium]